MLTLNCDNELVGQEDAERLFLQIWHSGKMPPCLLISGPKGVGKCTLAFSIARYVLYCPEFVQQGEMTLDLNSDGAPMNLKIPKNHPIRAQVSSNSHPNIKVVVRGWVDKDKGKRKKVIGIDEVRDIQHFLNLTSIDNGWRIVIIDGVDEMSLNAENSLLKTLEEPPNKTLILAITHNYGKLLPTTRSRCLKLECKKLSRPKVLQLLHLYRPDVEFDSGQAVANLSDGSIGRGLWLIDADGLVVYKEFMELFVTLPDLNIELANKFAGNLSKSESFSGASELIIWAFGRMIGLVARNQSAEVKELVPHEHAVLELISSSSDLDNWVSIWEELAEVFRSASLLNLDKKITILKAIFLLQKGVAK